MKSWRRLVAQLQGPRTVKPPVLLQVTNLTRRTTLATRLTKADTPETRKKGLLGRTSLPSGEGLWIVPCQSIHMFFMRFAIDLVYIDRKYHVRKVRSNVRPWRISACLTAHSVLELPAGAVRETGTQRGDVLEMVVASPEADAPASPEESPPILHS